MRVNPVQARGVAKLDLLTRAAITVIRREGRDLFTTQHIADEAGVSIGTVYRYWRNRKEVLDDIYPNRVEGLNGPERKPVCGRRPPFGNGNCYRVSNHPGDHANGELTWRSVDRIQDELPEPKGDF